MKHSRKICLFAFWAFILPALIIPLYDSGRREPNTNERVRIYLTMALVEEGTVVLDRPVQRFGVSLDRAEREGRIYCDKAPGLSFLAIPSYLIVRGIEMVRGSRIPLYLVIYLARIFTVGLLSALALAALFRFLRERVGEALAGFCASVYFLGTIAFPFSAVFFGHQAAASLTFFALYFLCRGRSSGRRGPVLTAGFLAGLAALVEYPAVLIGIGLFFLLALRRRDHFLVPSFVAGLLPAAAALLIYNRAAFGGCLDFGYAYTGHYFHLRGLADAAWTSALSLPGPLRIVQMVFSPYRGLFFFSPVLLFGLLGLPELRRRSGWTAAFLLVVFSLAYFFLNASLREWEGGWSPGLRHLAPILPFWIIPLALGARRLVCRRACSGFARGGALLLAAAAAVSVLTYTLITATYLYFPWGAAHPLKDITLKFLQNGTGGLTLWQLAGVPKSISLLLFSAAALGPAGYFSAAFFRRLLPSGPAGAAVVLLIGIWLSAILLLPTPRTAEGDKFLAGIYWKHRLARPFIAAARRAAAASSDPEERDYYSRAADWIAFRGRIN